MSDVDGMIGHTDTNGNLVAVVQVFGRISKVEFDELVEALKTLQQRNPKLKLEIRKAT